MTEIYRPVQHGLSLELPLKAPDAARCRRSWA